MASPQPRVCTIPASAPFLPTLIAALMDGRLVRGFPASRDPLELSTATLYLPTRRACRLARDVFLAVLKTDAAILPRIVPIGDLDEDEIEFAQAATGGLGATALELPEALGGFARNAALAGLILQWAKLPGMRAGGGASLVAHSPAAALALGGDLARLMDDMITRQVSWDRLKDVVPGEHDQYWEKTLEFLRIASTLWPKYLEEEGKIEPADRRDKLIAAEAVRLAGSPGPVIAAGSTGSMPATAYLLDTISKLPHGAVVLPGLDTDLDAPSWELIAGGDDGDPAQGHPQFAMHALLRRIGIAREAVEVLTPPAPHGRERLISEALRPSASTELWLSRLSDPGFAGHAEAALQDIAVIEAASAEEEAVAIAIALREAVDTPDKTAALVTPDRALARRVLAALQRWNVPTDDSGGNALAETPAGVFARLVAVAALGGLEPVPLLALLKHPLSPFDARAVAALERAILRGPRPQAGTKGLEKALKTLRDELAKLRRKEESSLHRSDPRTNLKDVELDAATQLIAKLADALQPLEGLNGKAHTFASIATAHRKAIETLGAMTKELDEVFEQIEESGRLPIEPGDYAELFHVTIAERVVRGPEPDVRVRIYGPLEARLQTVDRLVLGGLVEGVWPPQTRADPWLSRPMRHALGLDLPERRIGLSAHDFAQAMGAKEIVLTRAAKLGGAPTVASRFVQRLAAVVGEARWKAALDRGTRYVALARRLDEPAAVVSAPRPRPTPPLAARPKRLSVTEIEDWLRDPYTIYARHVLQLSPLEAVDTPPGAADRGTMIHNAIGDFTKTYADRAPDDAAGELERFGRKHFAELEQHPEARAFWWPRFLRIAQWFAGYEAGRRPGFDAMHAEIRGEYELPLADLPFKLTVRADRIERMKDGRYAILDYKTGAPPTARQVQAGLSPQLTLEAAILRQGGFKDIPAGASVSSMVYVRLRGGDPAGEPIDIKFEDSTPDEQADNALKQLIGVAARFANQAQPYLSLVHPMWRTHYGDYDHLARVKEWSLTAGAVDDIFE